jgi:putative transposase
MRSRYRVHHPDRAHFVTCTIVEWLSVFTSSACCDIVVHSLIHCREHKHLKIYAWVVLDNHFHAILAAPDLSGVLRDLKSFTAQKILEQLVAEKRDWLLNQLQYHRAAHKPNRYQVWQEGSHSQVIMDDATMLQKLDYLHNNPVKRGWITAPEHWCYSSAHEWLGGAQPFQRCNDWR